MSGQKRLNKVCKHNRCVAIPSKKRKDEVLDEMGRVKLDPKTGEPLMKETQLYNIYMMR